ncbi:hypothetical protein GTP38_23980 [Duganella sp. FT94W]|uniref:Alpha/beta hydrolase n=1 Tax=Duganella lactea TaxID=2692173 RepID=A0ABW9VEE2_9BURK|nr:hypothetical protein [Duganella lactea]MYM37392.1 hypothetical protein [Duganella lactea]
MTGGGDGKQAKQIEQHIRPAQRRPAILAALFATYVTVRLQSARAERDNPPAGRFIEIDGLRLHYIEQGEGPTLVLLHGHIVMADEERAGLAPPGQRLDGMAPRGVDRAPAM